MQDIQEGRECITSHVTNLSLVHQCFVKEVCSVLLLNLLIFFVALGILCLLLLHGGSGDVESHFDQFIGARSGLATAVLCASCWLFTIRICCGQRKLHGHLVLSSKVGVGDFGVGDLECRSVLHVERQLSLCELCFAPVPSAEGVFAVLDVDAVPDFECLGKSLEILE